jgi:hypothetical protein
VFLPYPQEGAHTSEGGEEVIITYCIDPEEDGQDVAAAHAKAVEMLSALQEFDELLRQKAKYGEGDSATHAAIWRDKLSLLLRANGVDLYE